MSKSVEVRASIDEALEETKYGKFNYFLIVVSGLILINVVLESVGISFVLPIINCDIDITYREKGMLAAVGFLGIISSSHLWGFLADTTGRRKIIGPTLIGGYFAAALSSFSPDFSTLIILRYLNGFLISGASATIFAYLGELHCNKLRNRAIMSAGFICAAASLLYPIVAWAAINQTWSFNIPLLGIVYKPWRLYILVIGLLGLFCGISFLYLPESPKYLLSHGREEEVIEVLRRIYALNTGNAAESYKITSILSDSEDMNKKIKINPKEKTTGIRVLLQSMWNQTAPLLMREHRRKTILTCVIQFWSFFTAHGLFIWFPFILNMVMQFTKNHPTHRLDICEILYFIEEAEYTIVNNTTGLVEPECIQSLELSTYKHTLSLETIFLILYIGVGYFTGKFGRIPTLFVILLVCGFGGILAAVIDIPLVAVYSLMLLLVCGLAITVTNAITVDIFPTHLRAMAVCISLMAGRIGSVTGTNLYGILLENHCKVGLFTSSITLILSGFLAFLLPKCDNDSRKLIKPPSGV